MLGISVEGQSLINGLGISVDEENGVEFEVEIMVESVEIDFKF